jgi:hypothetical protein
VVVTILLDKNTGEIYGSFPSFFGMDTDLAFNQETGRLTADGRDIWFAGPGMLQLTPTPTETPTSTPHPEVRVSDITSEDRLHFRDRGQGRQLVPYGLLNSPPPNGNLPSGPEGIDLWLLSGILLEAPHLRGDNFVEYTIGIPDNSGRFSEIHVLRELVWYRDPLNPREEERLFPISRAPKSPAGGFNLYGATTDLLSLEEGLSLYSNAVGRQVAFGITFSESETIMFNYLDKQTDEFCHGLDFCLDALERIKDKYPETLAIFRSIRNSNFRAYNGQDFSAFIYLHWEPVYLDN